MYGLLDREQRTFSLRLNGRNVFNGLLEANPCDRSVRARSDGRDVVIVSLEMESVWPILHRRVLRTSNGLILRGTTM